MTLKSKYYPLSAQAAALKPGDVLLLEAIEGKVLPGIAAVKGE